jgi:hypothetical protein
VKLTLDSSEPLEDAVRVVGALYGVSLVVAARNPESGELVAATESVRDEADQATPPGVPEPGELGRPKKAARPRRTNKRNKGRPGLPVDGSDSEVADGSTPGAVNAPRNADVRAWARENGLTVNSRGRVPASVLAAFRDAHSD